MALGERLRIVIDVVSANATKSVKSFRTELAQAQGATGKMQVAWRQASGAIQANAAAMAAAAGAAIFEFSRRSVQAFQEAVLAAEKFGQATGIGVEAASRWIAVGDDIGISGEQIQAAFQRMNLAIANGVPALAQFEDQIVRAADGTVDANATFTNLVTAIGAIQDPTLRAQAAQQVFGRSYANIARLMGMSADELRDKLLAVSDAQVFTSEEARRAKDLERALDDLGDSVQDLQLELGGELAPAVTEAIDGFMQMRDAADSWFGTDNKLLQSFQGLTRWADNLTEALGIGGVFGAWSKLDEVINGSKMDGLVSTFEAAFPAIEQTDNALTDLADQDALDQQAQQARDASVEIGNAEDAARAFYDYLRGQNDTEQALANVKDGFDDVTGAIWNVVATQKAADEAAATGAENAQELAWEAIEAQEDAADAIRGQRDAVVDYIEQLGNVPSDKTTQILAAYDAGEYLKVQRMLDQLAKTRTVTFVPRGVATGQLGNGASGGAVRAGGGDVLGGRSYMVGEDGPEVITMAPGARGYVNPSSSGAGGGVNVTVNVAGVLDDAMVRKIASEIERVTRGMR